MVPRDRILETARRENADIIGLSGLITPSLEEMVQIAREMKRQDFEVPLLIGGATTSPAHTSVKIDPHYEGAVVYVKDASRSVGVVQKLVSATDKAEYVETVKKDCAVRRERHANKSRLLRRNSVLSRRARTACENRSEYRADRCRRLPACEVFNDIPLDELITYIDWMPFFNAWEFHGKFPCDSRGRCRRRSGEELVSRCAATCCDLAIAEGWLRSRAVVGFFPANSVGDDIAVYGDESRQTSALETLHHLRQQRQKPDGQPNLCLADFIAPQDSGTADYVGAFAVTAGLGIGVARRRI